MIYILIGIVVLIFIGGMFTGDSKTDDSER